MSISKRGQVVEQIKICVHCGTEFIIKVTINGRGSVNFLRKKYCSKQCKKAYRKSHKDLFENVELVCAICSNKFWLPPSQARTATTCSNSCRFIYVANKRRKYSLEIRTCKTCKNTFEVNSNSFKSYCSHSCFNISQRTCITKFCLVCGCSFLEKPSHSGVHKFCSQKCQMFGQSNGMVKLHVVGRSGQRSDLGDDYFKSSLEADYARVCRFFDVEYIYEHKTFHYNLNKKYYTPDFFHPKYNFYVELKSVRNSGNHYSSMMTKNLAAHDELRKLGIEIYTLYMDDFYQMLRDWNVYYRIPNLENRDYNGTKYLIFKH